MKRTATVISLVCHGAVLMLTGILLYVWYEGILSASSLEGEVSPCNMAGLLVAFVLVFSAAVFLVFGSALLFEILDLIFFRRILAIPYVLVNVGVSYALAHALVKLYANPFIIGAVGVALALSLVPTVTSIWRLKYSRL